MLTYPLFFGLIVALVLFLVFRERPKYRCEACKAPMRFLEKPDRDAHMSAGQKLEAKLNAVFYDVYQCTRCERPRIIAHEARNTSYSRCPGCQHRALKSSPSVLRAASSSSGGLVEISRSCAHCGFEDKKQQDTPKLKSSTSTNPYSAASSDASPYYTPGLSSDVSSYSPPDTSYSDTSSSSSDTSSSYSDSSSSYSDSSSYSGGDSGGGGSGSSWD